MQVVYNHMFTRLFHLVSIFHPARQVWVAYPFCMGYGQLDMGDWRKGKNWQRYYIKLTKLVNLKKNFKKSAFLWLF